MKRFVWIGLITLFTSIGCIANRSLSDASIADANVSNLSRISLGMKESEVLGIMHTPYKQESYRIGQDTYHVWLYITGYRGLGQIRLVRPNLTPLIFRNARLLGVGYVYYYWLKHPHKPAASSPPSTKKPAIEDTKLEHTLEELQPSAPRPIENLAPPLPPQGPTSMSSPPPKEKPKEKPSEKDPPPSNKPEWNEEDEQMLQEESEQNFNFW